MGTSVRARLALDLLIVFLALVSVGIGVYEIVRPVPPEDRRVLDAIDVGIVAVFIVEYAWSARASGDAAGYARKNWIELPAMIPVTSGLVEVAGAIPLLRGLRLVRLARLVRLLRLAGALGRLSYATTRLRRFAGRAHLALILVAALGTALLGALALFFAERATNPRVDGYLDALWWAGTLVTTVGPGDVTPTTGAGRIVSVALMTLSVVFAGIFTAALALALLSPPPRAPARERARRRGVSGRGATGKRK